MEKENNMQIDYTDLMIRFLNGEITGNEIDVLKHWIQQSEENKNKFIEMKISWMATAQLQKIVPDESNKALLELDRRIEFNHRIVPSPKTFRINRIARIAAMILITFSLSSITTYFLTKNAKNITAYEVESSTYVFAPMGSKAMTILPDGSKVWLNAGSNLKYNPGSYGKSDRQVVLTGEGFFNVVSNAEKPFIVNAKNVKIKALGTEFNVKAYPEESKIEATLVKGIVKVEGEDNINQSYSITLKPNQHLILTTGKAKIDSLIIANPDKVDAKKLDNIKLDSLNSNIIANPSVINIKRSDLYTSWKDNRWVINGEKIENLAILLERRYNTHIIFNSEELKNYRFTGTFENETIEQILQILKMTAPLNYKIGKGTITLTLDASLKLKYKKYMEID